MTRAKPQPKRATVAEAAENRADRYRLPTERRISAESFIDGVKWMARRQSRARGRSVADSTATTLFAIQLDRVLAALDALHADRVAAHDAKRDAEARELAACQESDEHRADCHTLAAECRGLAADLTRITRVGCLINTAASEALARYPEKT